MRITLARFVLAVSAMTLAGCGALPPGDFPNQAIGVAGRPLVLEEIEQIVSDPNLGDEEKRLQLRELGIEDEKLIEALLTL